MSRAFNAVMRVVSSLVGLLMVAMGCVWAMQGLTSGRPRSYKARWSRTCNGPITARFSRWSASRRSCGATPDKALSGDVSTHAEEAADARRDLGLGAFEMEVMPAREPHDLDIRERGDHLL